MRNLVSIGRGIGLYIDVEQVYSKGSPRKLFSRNMNMKCIMLMNYYVSLT